MTFLFYFSFTLYFTGLINCIFLTNKNILNFLIASEIMFLGVDILYMGLSIILNEKIGLIYAVFILMLSVGESALGLGLCVLSLKTDNSIRFIDYSNFKY